MVSHLEVINIYTNAKLELSDFAKIMMELNRFYKTPVFQSKIAMLSVLGIDRLDKDLAKWLECDRIERRNFFHYRGDIVKIEDDLVYIIQFPSGAGKLEIGVITRDHARGKKCLTTFVRDFDKCLRKALDGRRLRHMNLKWYWYPINQKVDSYVTYEKRFMYPQMNEEEVELCKDIMDEKLRAAILRIAKRGTIKESEIAWREKDGDTFFISTLIEKKLVTIEYSLTCKKSAQVIDVFENEEKLKELSEKKFCTHCGNSLSKELIEKSFVLSEVGRKMIRGSHWMTIWLTQILLKLGISEKGIVWSLSDAGEEIDCAVEFKDQLWIFELKDRDFEAGDAHPLYYRFKKFKATKAVIITTRKVSKNARKVIEEFEHNPLQEKWNYLLIEGLDGAEEKIRKMIHNRILRDVFEKSNEISIATSIDFEPIFKKLFGKYALEYKGEYVQLDGY